MAWKGNVSPFFPTHTPTPMYEEWLLSWAHSLSIYEDITGEKLLHIFLTQWAERFIGVSPLSWTEGIWFCVATECRYRRKLPKKARASKDGRVSPLFPAEPRAPHLWWGPGYPRLLIGGNACVRINSWERLKGRGVGQIVCCPPRGGGGKCYSSALSPWGVLIKTEVKKAGISITIPSPVACTLIEIWKEKITR